MASPELMGFSKYVDATLGVSCLPVRRGISWVFRSESRKQAFAASYPSALPADAPFYSRRRLLKNAAASGAVGVVGTGLSVFATNLAGAAENRCLDPAETEQRVRRIIVEHLGASEKSVTLEASYIDDLGADSLDIVELVIAYEEEFGVEIPDDAAEQILTVGDTVEFLCRNGG